MTWEAGLRTETEKLRCYIVLDDDIGLKLSPRAGPAYFRAFIVENRATHEIQMKFRYRYRDPDERNWYFVATDKPDEEGVKHLVSGIGIVLRTTASLLGFKLFDHQIQAYYPPDDNGDPMSTIIWLEMNGLVEITEVREEPGDGRILAA